jgi:glucosamine--fructose-6-phosphate aminotransferase (isomerizing)
MCGIVAYVGRQEAAPIVLDGLARLEYRGYDSAGLAVLDAEGTLSVVKDVGKLSVLRGAVDGAMPAGGTGLGHTRWATHGKPTQLNAHPHLDEHGDIAVIHNGIVENHAELRRELQSRGHSFTSETDTEVIPHLIAEGVAQGLDLLEATRAAAGRIEGAAAVVALRRQEPGVLVAARIANAGGVVIGHGDGESFVASDLPAIVAHTGRVVFLDDGDIARVTADDVTYLRLDGTSIEKEPLTLEAGEHIAARGAFDTYMQKEIAEQPDAVFATLAGAASFQPPAVELPDLNLLDAKIAAIRRVVLVGMGTSFHAASIGRGYIERLAGITAEVDSSSEYRYRSPILDDATLVIAVAQSGETVDTLAAMHNAREHGATVIAVCNTPGSQATRIAHGTVYLRCGPEVAVASTKTFLGSLAALYLLACHLGSRRGFLDDAALASALGDLQRVPQLIGEALKTEDDVAALAQRYCRCDDFLFLGRGLQYAVAMEGALKLKEVSYIHAEGYSAGEMKHGPIALIDDNMPVVVLAPQDEHYGKMINNVEQVRARDGIVIAIATEGDSEITRHARDVVFVPPCPPLLAPLVTAVPLQLLSYHVARCRGLDVDQPRNLAKVVTVE